MKSTTQALLDLIPNPKTINARATFRVMRPQFAVNSISGGSIVSDNTLIDTCAYGTGILRVANYNDVLYTQNVQDLYSAWPAWVDTGIALVAGSRPGVDDGFVWYQKASSPSELYYRDFGDWSTEVLGRSDGEGVAEFLAPISNIRCYTLKRNSSDTAFVINGAKGDGTPGGVWIENNDFALYEVSAWNLDAVPISDDGNTVVDCLYFEDRDTGRVSEMRVSIGSDDNPIWGKPRPVIAIDAIDENQGFHLHGAELIDGKVVLSGRLTRSSDTDPVSMDVYMFGPEDFSLGRDMFISQEHIGGKIVVVGSELVVCGPNYWGVAAGTNLFGVDSVANKLVTSDIESVQLQEAENRSSTVVLSLSTDLDRTVICRGAQLELEVAYSNNWMTAMTCEIDRVVSTKGVGESLTVYATNLTAKRLSQWAPDQGIYIPSQAFSHSYASDMSKVVRADGQFNTEVPVATAGKYDDTAAYWNYQGDWHADTPAGAYNNTIHYNNSTYPGYATFDFVGTSFTFTFTKYTDRGIHDIWVDDELIASVDAYNATKIQGTYNSPTLEAGVIHTFKVSHGSASGYIDVDAIEIFGSSELADSALVPAEFNKLSVLYTAARASRGGIMRAKFWNESADDITERNPRFGVGLNYYRESKVEAAARLGVDYNDVDDDDCGHNGIVAIYSRNEASGSPGVQVYRWENSVLTPLHSASVTLPTGVYVWLQIRFLDGWYRVSWREDGSTSWTNAVTWLHDDTTPWTQEDGGRGCVVMEKQLMASTPCYGLTSDGDTLGVDLHTIFPTSGKIVVDDEIMSYSGKSTYNQKHPTGYSDAMHSWVLFFNSAVQPASGFGTGERVVLNGCGLNSYYGDGSFSQCALVATYPPGGDTDPMYCYGLGHTFRIVGFDATAPAAWVVGALTAGWLGRVGETGYGSWMVTGDMTGVYVAPNPAGAVSEGGELWTGPYSYLMIKPALWLSERGSNGTTAAAHGESLAYKYVDIALNVETIEFFSEEEDIMLADALRHVVRLAGGDVTERNLIDVDQTVGSDWSITDIDDGKKDFIAEIDIPSGVPAVGPDAVKLGWLFYGSDSFSAGTGTGYFVCVENYYLSLYTIDAGVLTLVEQVLPNMASTRTGVLRISVQDNRFSVWLNHRLVHVFYDETFSDEAYLYKAFAVHNPQGATVPDVHLRYSELNDLMADIVVGVRGKGMSILGEMTNNRRVYFRCEPNGNLRFYKTLEDVGSIPDIVISEEHEETDDVLTRVRMEGISVTESVDWSAIAEHGNVFETANSMYANTVQDLLDESDHYFELRQQKSDVRNLEVVFHPALQPGDGGAIVVDGTSVDVGIMSTNVVFGFRGENFGVDANIEVYAQ